MRLGIKCENHHEEMALKTLGLRIKKKVGALQHAKIYRMESGCSSKRDLEGICNVVRRDAEESGLLEDTGGNFSGRWDCSVVLDATDRSVRCGLRAGHFSNKEVIRNRKSHFRRAVDTNPGRSGF